MDILKQRRQDQHSKRVCREVLELVDWAESFGWSRTANLSLSSTASASKSVVRFRDRFMGKDRNSLTGYDASEGALYVLFLAVLAVHERSPDLCAVDNADHGIESQIGSFFDETPLSMVS